MSRAALHSHQSQLIGHQSAMPAGMKQSPGADDQKPSRLMQMRDDYQRRMLKEKEEKLVHMYEDHHRKNLERAERVVRGPPGGAGAAGAYPNSKLPQPGGLYSQQNGAANGSPSVRDFFRERRELESKGGHVPPIKQHYNQSRGSRAGSGTSHHKNSAGVDRSKPLAPIQARHSGVSSAPNVQPGSFNNRPRLPNKNPASCPDTPDENDNYYYGGKSSNSARGAAPKKPFPPASRALPSQARGVKRDPAPRSQEEKLSDFQKWQMDQNKAREERLKKLNMRAPPSGRESEGREGRYEYEEEDEDEDMEEETPQSHRSQEDAIARQQRELMEKIAQQQTELNRMRKEREEEEERERMEAEMLRKQEMAERERRRRQQQEDARQRREEEARARREEQEEQRRAAADRARKQQQLHQQQQQQERQHRNYNEDDDDGDYSEGSAPNTYRSRASAGRPYGGGGGNQSQNNTNKQPTPRDRPSPAEFSQRHPHPPPARRQQPQSQPQRTRYPAGRPGHDRQDMEQDDERPVPGPGVDFYAQAALEDEQGPKVKLVLCRTCDRKFAADRIEKHQAACKNAHKKRKVFDPTKMRTEGTEMAKYVSKNAHKKEPAAKKKADWRRQHDEFITNIRYAKKMQQMEQQGVPLKDLPPPPPSHNPDLIPCPNCGRTFNETAAERHIPRCKDLKTRPAANKRR